MKKIYMLLILPILLSGCGFHKSPEIPPTEIQEVTQTLPSSTEPEETAPVIAAKLTYTVYLPDENAEGFVQQTVETDQIDANSVLAELQAKGAIPDTVAINSFGLEGTQLVIDFNQAFGDLVCSTGTSGERMIIGSVFNTFMNAFQADTVSFTVEGGILESGHVIYDFPITFME